MPEETIIVVENTDDENVEEATEEVADAVADAVEEATEELADAVEELAETVSEDATDSVVEAETVAEAIDQARELGELAAIVARHERDILELREAVAVNNVVAETAVEMAAENAEELEEEEDEIPNSARRHWWFRDFSEWKQK